MLNLLLLTAPGAIVGAISGLLAARWLLAQRKQAKAAMSVEPPDPVFSAELHHAAVKYATEKGRPEAAGLVAAKLHLLYELERRRRS